MRKLKENDYYIAIYEGKDGKQYGVGKLIENYHLVWTPTEGEDSHNILVWPQELFELIIEKGELKKISGA